MRARASDEPTARGALYRANTTFSDYAAKVFGFATFGRVYGTIICFSGLINLSQPLIDAASHELFHDDPTPINVTLATLGLVFGTALVVYVWVKGPQVQAVEHVVDERSRLLPDVIEEEV